MPNKYIITYDELINDYQFNLGTYVTDVMFVNTVIKQAYERCVTAILHFNDNLKGRNALFEKIDNNEDLVYGFKKLQFQVIYNMCFLGDSDPIDTYCEEIICFDMNMGKINGFQKGIYRK